MDHYGVGDVAHIATPVGQMQDVMIKTIFKR